MGLKKIVLNILLSIANVFRFLMPQKANRITFISITQDHPTQDFKLLYDALKKEGTYDIRLNLIVYEPTIKSAFLYLFNCLKQLYEIHTSKLIILNDNNYVVTKFKPEKTKVIQLWHACGAVKKFGNQIPREYPIKNYDYVIANSKRWIQPYCEAFGVSEEKLKITGMPRVDRLCDMKQRQRYQDHFYHKYPHLKQKKIVLYAPTFRGNIVKGLRHEGMDMKRVVEALDCDTVLLYKLHPLLKDVVLDSHERLYNVFDENLYMLMSVCDVLISDYSSILFDFSLLHKKIICYANDMEEYAQTIGFNVDYEKEMPCTICTNEEMLIEQLKDVSTFDKQRLQAFQETFMPFQDGMNTKRTLAFIQEIMNSL